MIDASHLRATRAGYDAVAADYAAHFSAELDGKPFGRAMLAAFSELVRAAGNQPVLDVGCGPGNTAAHLDSLGTTVHGIDLSPSMVAAARYRHPALRFTEGSMSTLEQAGESLGGVVAWYSIIHVPPDDLPHVFAEFHRVLIPGGHLLLAFQVGEEPLHVTRAFGRSLSLEFQRLQPEGVAERLQREGFVVEASLVRAPDEEETTAHAHVLARKPGAATVPR